MMSEKSLPRLIIAACALAAAAAHAQFVQQQPVSPPPPAGKLDTRFSAPSRVIRSTASSPS
jgi:hypothetical protein